MARWGSNVILRYIADAPLSALTQVYTLKTDAAARALKALGDAVLPSDTGVIETLALEDGDE